MSSSDLRGGNSGALSTYLAAGALGVGCIVLWKMADSSRAAEAKAQTDLLKQRMEMMELEQKLKLKEMETQMLLQQQQQVQMQAQHQQQQQQHHPSQLHLSNSFGHQHASRAPGTPYEGHPLPAQPNPDALHNFSITQDPPTPPTGSFSSGMAPMGMLSSLPSGGGSGSGRVGREGSLPGMSSSSQRRRETSNNAYQYPDEGPPTFTTVKSSTSFIYRNQEPGSTLGGPQNSASFGGPGSTLTVDNSGSLLRHQSALYRDNTNVDFGDADVLGSTLGGSASQPQFSSPHSPQHLQAHSPIGGGGGGGRSGFEGAGADSQVGSQRNRSDSAMKRGESQTANDSVADFLAKKKAMTEVKLDLLHHVPSFRGVNEKFLERIAGHLQHESYGSNESICTEGEYGDCMYFVASGQCEGWRKGKFFKKFTEGQYFGEVALLRGVVRAVTVRALSACDLFYLSRDPFLEAIAEFPEVRDAMEKEVIMRYEEAKYTATQRKDPHVRKKIEDNVGLQFKKMKSQFNKKMKWQLNQKIGSGAAGDVYSAINLGTGKPMAVKVLAIAGASRSLLLSVQQESEMMQRLHHPNLVQGYGLEKDETEGHLYIFMELLPMGCIQKVLKEFGPMSETACRMYSRQMLKGLQYLHEHGVLHRDIKPANMLISAQGTVKLADFGISRYGTSVATQTITGTPAYMSPDAINGRYSVASDIWALGCSFLEMITRQVPWHELQLEGPTQLIFHIATCNTTPTLPKAYDRESFAKAAANNHEKSPKSNRHNSSSGVIGEEEDDEEETDRISPMLYDLLKTMLAANPQDRGDCATLLQHEWFSVDEDLLPSQPHRLQQLSGDVYGESDPDEDENGVSGGNSGGGQGGTCTSLQNAFASGEFDEFNANGNSSREQTPSGGNH